MGMAHGTRGKLKRRTADNDAAASATGGENNPRNLNDTYDVPQSFGLDGS